MSDIQADANADEKTEQSPYQFGVWYPIETAPKNGTDILFGMIGDTLMEVGSCYDDGDFWAIERMSPKHITHWMPLPPPPSVGDRTDEDADKDRA